MIIKGTWYGVRATGLEEGMHLEYWMVITQLEGIIFPKAM